MYGKVFSQYIINLLSFTDFLPLDYLSLHFGLKISLSVFFR